MLAEPRVAVLHAKTSGIWSERHPPPTARSPEGFVDEPSINVSCPNQRSDIVPEVTDHPRRAVRHMLGLHPLLQRDQDFKLVPRKALRVPFVPDPVHLLEGACAASDAELPVDPEERDREDDAA